MHIFAVVALVIAATITLRDYYEAWRLRRRRARTPSGTPTLHEEVEEFVRETHSQQLAAFKALKRRGVIPADATFNGRRPTPQLSSRQNPILSPGLERAKTHEARVREERRRRRAENRRYIMSPMAAAIEAGVETDESTSGTSAGVKYILSPMTAAIKSDGTQYILSPMTETVAAEEAAESPSMYILSPMAEVMSG